MRRLVLVATGWLLALTACGTAGQGEQGSATTEEPEPAAAESSASESPDEPDAADEGQTSVPDALAFTAETLDGTPFRGADLAGKPVVLWFWAPWCPTCRAQASGVNQVAGKYDGRVSVVGVGGLDDPDAMRAFAAGLESEVTVLEDEEGAVWRRFGVSEQSSYVVLDESGTTVASGYLDDGELRDLVDDLAG